MAYRRSHRTIDEDHAQHVDKSSHTLKDGKHLDRPNPYEQDPDAVHNLGMHVAVVALLVGLPRVMAGQIQARERERADHKVEEAVLEELLPPPRFEETGNRRRKCHEKSVEQFHERIVSFLRRLAEAHVGAGQSPCKGSGESLALGGFPGRLGGRLGGRRHHDNPEPPLTMKPLGHVNKEELNPLSTYLVHIAHDAAKMLDLLE